MGFQHPAILWWLFVLVVPILIHLFNFRRHKTLLFSDIRLLRVLQTESSKTNKLKHLLILISRLLAMTALVVAFAKPFLGNDATKDTQAAKVVSVYLDNSLSMQRRGGETSLLDEMRAKAAALVEGFEMNTRFVLLTNDFHPRHNRLLSKEEYLQELGSVVPTSATVGLDDVILRNRTITVSMQYASRWLFALSDFQRAVFKTDSKAADSTLHLVLAPAAVSSDQNIFVDSLWLGNPLLRPGMESIIHVRVSNDGSSDVAGIPLSIDLDGKRVAIANADIAAGQSTELAIPFIVPSKGFHQGIVSLQDYPIVFDDALFFSFEVLSQLKVLEIYENQPDTYLNMLFREDPDVAHLAVNALGVDMQSLKGYQMIVLNQLQQMSSGLQDALKAFVEAGGSLVLFPGEQSQDAYNQLTVSYGIEYGALDVFATRMGNLSKDHPFFKDVIAEIPNQPDFPQIKKHLRINLLPEKKHDPLLSLVQDDPLLVLAQSENQGNVYAFSIPTDQQWSAFSANALFPALMYKMLYISPLLPSAYLVLGEQTEVNSRLPEDAEASDIRIEDAEKTMSLIPGFRSGRQSTALIVEGLKNESAHYRVMVRDSLAGVFSSNLQRKESYLASMSADELLEEYPEEAFKSTDILTESAPVFAAEVSKMQTGASLWRWFIAAALLFLLAEILMIRFWK